MEAYAEKALGQHEVRLHEFRCHMLRQKRKPRPTEQLPSTSPFTAHVCMPLVLLHAKLSDSLLRQRRRELPGKRVALKKVGIMQQLASLHFIAGLGLDKRTLHAFKVERAIQEIECLLHVGTSAVRSQKRGHVRLDVVLLHGDCGATYDTVPEMTPFLRL
uniref:Uncharacterized protein n=1 Tax=Trichuris muris TaxID=70415 RepID=A0A5S6QU07_TRIMR